MESKAQILAKSILQYFQEMNDPFFDNLQDIAGIENMAREILKDVETEKMEKPTPDKYGYYSSIAFDDDESGWQIEGGEEEYYKALAIWKSQQAETAPEPTETPLSHETLLSLGYTLTYNCFTIGQRCYTEKNSMNVIEHTNDKGEQIYTIGQTFKEVKTVKDLKHE